MNKVKLKNVLTALTLVGSSPTIAETKTVIVNCSSTTKSYSIESGMTAYNNFGCASCHGSYGYEGSVNGYPILRGLDKDYIIKQLEDFQSGERENPTMNAIAPMAEGYETNIAEYIESLGK